jgi:argininosuccinate lyase
VQNDRGKGEMLVLGAALGPALDLGRLAADLIWFSSDELGYLRLGQRVTTGSSIMPNKRNPDVLELIRASAQRLRSRHAEIGAVCGALTSGYHRDLQLTKEPFLEGMQSCLDIFSAIRPVLDSLEVDPDRCKRALARTSGATDEAYRRVAEGEAFRSAYKAVAADPERAVSGDPAELWRGRTHLGAPGALDLGPCREALQRARRWVEETTGRLEAVWRLLEQPEQVLDELGG